jgi:hypothetical protein
MIHVSLGIRHGYFQGTEAVLLLSEIEGLRRMAAYWIRRCTAIECAGSHRQTLLPEAL